jgi:hypothetical protein
MNSVVQSIYSRRPWGEALHTSSSAVGDRKIVMYLSISVLGISKRLQGGFDFVCIDHVWAIVGTPVLSMTSSSRVLFIRAVRRFSLAPSRSLLATATKSFRWTSPLSSKISAPLRDGHGRRTAPLRFDGVSPTCLRLLCSSHWFLKGHRNNSSQLPQNDSL